MRTLTRRGFGFVAVPIVSLLTPLLVLPLLARAATIDEFASIALGQSVGMVASLALSYGWTVTGPADVARVPEHERPGLWLDSVRMRSLAFAVLLVPTAGIAYLVDPSRDALAPTMAVALLLAGFSPAWYGIGQGQPSIVILYDAIPRTAGNVVGVLLAVAFDHLYLYAIVLGLFTILPVGVLHRSLTRGLDRAALGPRAVTLRSNLAPTLTELIAGLYSMGSTALVGASVSSPQVIAVFSGAERFTRTGAASIAVTSSVLTAWVAEAKGAVFRKRVGVSLGVHLVLGVAGALALGLLGPAMSALLLGEPLRMDTATGFAFGVFFLGWSLETVTARHVLAARRRTTSLLASTIIGSAVGCVAIVVGGQQWGTAGAASGLAIGIFTILAVQMPVAYDVVRREVREHQDTPA
ncbi:hypothetical protein GCM10009710_00070 [Aeromicrobium alkaliterrae]|uniref:Polysaccharide biosynthesis protein n=1 Tax=Aeromicrobium alkaliterrae TaxID=302168 RepID=A0ABP4VI41_9ACTN